MYKFDTRLGRSDRAIHKMSVEDRAELLKQIWRDKIGYELDLEHPKTFNEKIQWYKLYYHHPDMTRCVDKVTFKDYIAEKLGEGYTSKILRVWSSPDEVCFDGLPDRFVVKSNCQCEGHYIKLVMDKSQCDLSTLAQEIKDYWFNPLNLLINGFCNAYHDVKPKVFVEEYVEQSNEAPDDCKLFCFHGVPKFCCIIKERFQNGDVELFKYPLGYYTPDWTLIDVAHDEHPIYRDAPRPKDLDKMIEISRILSDSFPFVRVDFFPTDKKLYLSELTFYPSGGLAKYTPAQFSEDVGNMLHII